MKVTQFYNKNQFIIKDEEKDKIVFQSYDSIVATICKGQLILGYDWDYSLTTTKHLYLFLKDYLHLLHNINDQRENIEKALNSSNKKKAIQNLISNKKITYNQFLK